MGSESARIYAAKYLHDGSDTMFTTVHSLRAYAKTAGSDFYGNPCITWAKDSLALAYKGQRMELSNLRSGFLALVDNLEQLLLSGLVFRGEGYLESRSPANFIDDPMWSAGGECFVDLQGVATDGYWQQTLGFAMNTVLGKALVVEMREAAVGKSQVYSKYTA